MYSRIIGTGSYLPEKVLTNRDLERMVDTSDEWIVTRTGIRERHIAADDEMASDLALGASRRALAAAGIAPEDLGPDHRRHHHAGHDLPQHGLHPAGQAGHPRRAPAFDVQAVCSGFIYALATADLFVRSGALPLRPGSGRRGIFPHPRLDRPLDLRAVRRRRRCGRAGGERCARVAGKPVARRRQSQPNPGGTGPGLRGAVFAASPSLPWKAAPCSSSP